MGLDPMTMLAISQVGSSALSSLFAPDPYQRRQSFAGTGADPVSWMTDVRNATNNVLNSAVNNANQPITIGPDVALDGSSPTPGMSFDNPDLPFPLSSPTGKPGRVSLEGFGIQTPVTSKPTYGSSSPFPVPSYAGEPGGVDRQRPPNQPSEGTAIPRPATQPASPPMSHKNLPQIQAAYQLLQHAQAMG